MNVSYVDGIVVAFCGAGLLLSIYLGQTDLAQSIAVGLRSEERRVGKGVDLGGRRIIKKKKEHV